MSSDASSAPIDPVSYAALAAAGLRLGLVDTADPAIFGQWLQSMTRGFHGPAMSDALVRDQAEGLGFRRTTGVWDDSLPQPAAPVATVSSWAAALTVPGERSIPSWAISMVTVAPTHRRRGVARAMLEGELRTASALGLPMAMLTVSESTIYSRYGFAPAALSADWTIDTTRARWAGPDAATGRIHFVAAEQARADLATLHERTRLSSPGEIQVWQMRWDGMLHLLGDDKEAAGKVRVVRFDDAAGIPQGIALYRVEGGHHEFTSHTIELGYLVSATPEAYAALWRFLVEMDLVMQIKAPGRSVDEPFVWQLSDLRAASSSPRDHQWLRILDVPASLEGRTYSAAGRFAFEVSDPLRFASGSWVLEVAPDGTGRVEVAGGSGADAAASVALSVNELSALYLGGVSAVTLTAAGRITERVAGSAAALDAAFRSPRTPWLSVWY